MNDEPTTVSWKVIEPGWRVITVDGSVIGTVHMTVGDRNADIFNGLAITQYGGPNFVHELIDRPRYVRADQIASIKQGTVRLAIDSEEAGRLPEHEAPESVAILPESAGRSKPRPA